MTVISAHMKSGGGNVRHTNQLIERVNRIDGPLICGVDFNSKSNKIIDEIKITCLDCGGTGRGKTQDAGVRSISRARTRPCERCDGTAKAPISELEKVLINTKLRTAYKEVTGKHIKSTYQRRCCGEQGEKIVTKNVPLRNYAKDIDHSFYSRHFEAQGVMTLKDENWIDTHLQAGGLPAACNSSDHIYVCAEYSFNDEVPDQPKTPCGRCNAGGKGKKPGQISAGVKLSFSYSSCGWNWIQCPDCNGTGYTKRRRRLTARVNSARPLPALDALLAETEDRP